MIASYRCASEFNSLLYVIERSSRILLFAHKNPDPDSVGSVSALKQYLVSLGKTVHIGCLDPFPKSLEHVFSESFLHPDTLDLKSYDAVIACDSVERGFHTIRDRFDEHQIVALLDHHHDITLSADINIIDAAYSSTCEIVYEFLNYSGAVITKDIATMLMVGLLDDTGSFQHANTSTRVFEIGADLLKKGAPLQKITHMVFSNRKLATLKLWGTAFNKAKFYEKIGMIVTVLTAYDILECEAASEDLAQIANILATIPGVKFALVLSQRTKDIIKGSFRSEENGRVDVSEIARRFGGGGHKLASGFEMRGTLVDTVNGWVVQ